MSGAVLALITLIAGIGWMIKSVVWPMRDHGRCSGTGYLGTAKASRPCPGCGATGKKERIGAIIASVIGLR